MDTKSVFYEGYAPAKDPMIAALPGGMFCGAVWILAYCTASAVFSLPLSTWRIFFGMCGAVLLGFFGIYIWILRLPRHFLRITGRDVSGCGVRLPGRRSRKFRLPVEDIRRMEVTEAGVTIHAGEQKYVCRDLPNNWRIPGIWEMICAENIPASF